MPARTLWRAVSRRLAARAVARTLGAFDEHMLADIGLERDDVEDAVRHLRRHMF
jgi:uncharacterized protein YjiS (DUF1127 family)